MLDMYPAAGERSASAPATMLVPVRLCLRRTDRTPAAPKVSLTSGRPCSALGLTACPAALKPRPGAAHYRPEVRTARPPRPDTTAARLRALSSARTDSGWTRMAGPAETRRLAAEGKRPPAAKASRPAQDLVSPARRQTNRERQLEFAPFGAVMKGANRAEAQRAVIYSAAETTPAPASQDPRLRLHCT